MLYFQECIYDSCAGNDPGLAIQQAIGTYLQTCSVNNIDCSVSGKLMMHYKYSQVALYRKNQDFLNPLVGL